MVVDGHPSRNDLREIGRNRLYLGPLSRWKVHIYVLLTALRDVHSLSSFTLARRHLVNDIHIHNRTAEKPTSTNVTRLLRHLYLRYSKYGFQFDGAWVGKLLST